MKSPANAFGKLALLAATLISVTGCNLYSFIDKPGGDQQLLSAARACFDRGDYSCAADNYAKLSDSSAEVRASEQAFMILDQNGAGIGSVMSSLGGSASASGGQFITRLASKIGPQASPATRFNIYTAYKYAVNQIPTNGPLRGLVRFLSASALMAEMLAENSNGLAVKATDLAVNAPTACALAAVCFTAPECNAPAGNKIFEGAIVDIDTISAANDAAMSAAAPTFRMMNSAISKISVALSSAEMGSGSAFGGSSSGFASAVTSGAAFIGAPGDAAKCFRFALLSQGIGGI